MIRLGRLCGVSPPAPRASGIVSAFKLPERRRVNPGGSIDPTFFASARIIQILCDANVSSRLTSWTATFIYAATTLVCGAEDTPQRIGSSSFGLTAIESRSPFGSLREYGKGNEEHLTWRRRRSGTTSALAKRSPRPRQ